MARTTERPSVDQATAALLAVQLRATAGEATADEIVAAQQAVADAHRYAADLAVAQASIDDVRTRHENIAAVEAGVAWLEGNELRDLLDRYEHAHTAALAAVAADHAAWAELTGAFHGHMRTIRRHGVGGDVPPGVAVTALTGFDVEVVTPSGVWNSASGLREDPARYLLEGAPVIARGGKPRSDLLVRLRRWYQRGVGAA